MGVPSIWLGGALAVCIALFAANVIGRHKAEVAGARNEGIAIGTGAASKAAVESVEKVAEAERVAEAAIPITTERQKLIDVCNRSASCEDRGKFK